MDSQMNVKFLAGLQKLREKGFERWDQVLQRKEGGFFKRECLDEHSASINFQWISMA